MDQLVNNTFTDITVVFPASQSTLTIPYPELPWSVAPGTFLACISSLNIVDTREVVPFGGLFYLQCSAAENIFTLNPSGSAVPSTRVASIAAVNRGSTPGYAYYQDVAVGKFVLAPVEEITFSLVDSQGSPIIFPVSWSFLFTVCKP